MDFHTRLDGVNMDRRMHLYIIFPLMIAGKGKGGCFSCQKILANGIVCTRHPCTFTARPPPSKHVDGDQLQWQCLVGGVALSWVYHFPKNTKKNSTSRLWDVSLQSQSIYHRQCPLSLFWWGEAFMNHSRKRGTGVWHHLAGRGRRLIHRDVRATPKGGPSV